MLVYNPIHQLKTHECYRENNPTIFIYITGGDPEHLVNVFRGDHGGEGRDEPGAGAGPGGLLLVEPLGEPRPVAPDGVLAPPLAHPTRPAVVQLQQQDV